jgi:uncharacterized membrane protein YkgB
MSTTMAPPRAAISITSEPQALPVVTRLDLAARVVSRWGLVAILIGIGLYKFTAAEAAAIQPLVANSPFMGWMYQVGSVSAVSAVIGVAEIAVALLLALHVISPRVGLVGGVAAAATFLMTLSFIFTTPGAITNAGVLSFLVKDVFLFGAALVATSESLRAIAAGDPDR